MKKSPIKIFAFGTIMSAIIVVATLLFMNPPQCPSGYQKEITNCVTGANIGLGINILLAIGVWIITIFISLVRYAQITLARKDESKAILTVLTVAVTLTSALAAYMVIWVLMSSLSTMANSG